MFPLPAPPPPRPGRPPLRPHALSAPGLALGAAPAAASPPRRRRRSHRRRRLLRAPLVFIESKQASWRRPSPASERLGRRRCSNIPAANWSAPPGATISFLREGRSVSLDPRLESSGPARRWRRAGRGIFPLFSRFGSVAGVFFFSWSSVFDPAQVSTLAVHVYLLSSVFFLAVTPRMTLLSLGPSRAHHLGTHIYWQTLNLG